MEPDTHDDARSAAAMKTLASECRLQILRQLTKPRALRDIMVYAASSIPGRPPRPLARQSVQKHLQRLQEEGLVVARDGSANKEYVVDGGRLYEVLERMRRLASVAGAAPFLGVQERPLRPQAVGVEPPQKPHLVLVHGVPEGRTLALDQGPAWTIGRDDAASFDLGYDPYVSREHCRIVRDGSRTYLEAVPGARNGTYHNWREVPAGRAVELRPGDVIGVGRTLLVYREPAPTTTRVASVRPTVRPRPSVVESGTRRA